MKSNLKKLNRILDILDIDNQIVCGNFDNYEESLEQIKFSNDGVKKVVLRYLQRMKKSIEYNLKKEKLVKVYSSVAVYTLFVPSEENENEFYILSPYLENYISVNDYKEMLIKQSLDIEDNVKNLVVSFPVTNKKKFNYLLELIAEREDINYLEEIEIFQDTSVKTTKKITYDTQYGVNEVLENQAKLHRELREALLLGDITKVEMMFDLRGYSLTCVDYPTEDNAHRRKLNYVNDVLHAVLLNSEASLIDVDSLWINIKNKLDNYDFSEDIIRKYCLLIDKERYKNKQQVVRNCILYINDHIREKISLNDVSDYLGVNKSYLSSIFNREMGFSIVDYIHDKRISNSKYLLSNTDFSISEISDYVGYYDTSYFIRIFKSLEKITPLKYRELSAKENNI